MYERPELRTSAIRPLSCFQSNRIFQRLEALFLAGLKLKGNRNVKRFGDQFLLILTRTPSNIRNDTSRRKIRPLRKPAFKPPSDRSKRFLKAYRVHRTGSCKLDRAFLLVSQPDPRVDPAARGYLARRLFGESSRRNQSAAPTRIPHGKHRLGLSGLAVVDHQGSAQEKRSRPVEENARGDKNLLTIVTVRPFDG